MLVHGNSFSFAVLVRFDILQTCYKNIFGFKKPFFLKNTKLCCCNSLNAQRENVTCKVDDGLVISLL